MVLLLIILPLTLSLLLTIPAVQNYAVDVAASYASRSLGTTVSIGHVDIGLFNRIHLDKIYVEDYQRDTLLYADHLDGIITSFGLAGGGLEISRSNLSGARLNLRETETGEMNIKQLVDKLSRRDREKKGNFKLAINYLRVDSTDVNISRLEHRNPEYGIDFQNIRIRNIKCLLSDFRIEGSAIRTYVQSFSAGEASGLRINSLTGGVFLDRGVIRLNDAKIWMSGDQPSMASSNVDIPSLSLEGRDWSTFKYFVDSVRMEGSLRKSKISSDVMAYISDKFRPWDMVVSDVDLDIDGTVSDLHADIINLRTRTSTSLSAVGTVKGLPDVSRSKFDVQIRRLSTSAADMEYIADAVAGVELPAKRVDMLARAGKMGVRGSFKGSFSSFSSHASLNTDIGRAELNLRMRAPGNGTREVRGNVSARNFDLGRLLDNKSLGRTTFAANVDGAIGDNADAAVKGKIDQFEFNGYTLDSIRLDGLMSGRRFDGRVHSSNRALEFDFEGLVSLDDEVPYYDFCLDLDNADLNLLGINRRDSISQLSAHVDAAARGRSFDDLNGKIEIADARYVYNADTVVSERILIEGRNTASNRLLRLTSDIADASYVGRTGYQDAFAYLNRCMRECLPSFFEPESERRQQRKASDSILPPDAFSILNVRMKNVNSVTGAIVSGLMVGDSTRLNLMFNPASGYLSLKAKSDYVERNRLLVTNIELDVANQNDSLTVYGRSDDFYAGAFFAVNPVIFGGAKNDMVRVSAEFADTLRKVSGKLGLRADITRDSTAGRKINLRILPSTITRHDNTWTLGARRLEIDTARVVIDRFTMRNDKQELAINGIASRSRSDSVTLRLNNFDLGPFMQFAERIGYVVEGKTNGFATAKSALRGAEITAHILMDSVEVNGIASPALLLDSRWDFEESRARFFVSRRESGDTLMRGYYDPTGKRYYARAKIDSMQMALINPVLQGVVSGTEGTACLELVLRGHDNEASLRGQVRVSGLKTKVDFTQVEYSAPDVVLDIVDNRFSTTGAHLFDSEGNRGTVDFEMNLQHLSNISYSLRVRPENMLVLNTTELDNDFFYGKVHASGSALVKGDKQGVTMNIVASTEDNSEFFMPLSSKSSISRADFVIFESGNHPDTSNYLVRKRMMFERRQKPVSTGGNMDINMTLEVRPTTDVQLLIDPAQGDIIKGKGEGLLNIHVNPRSNVFEMYGDYAITEGSYRFNLMNIVSKPFTIRSGSTVVWTGEPLDAMLNIDAVYSVKTSLAPITDDFANDRAVPVECIINISGRLTDPTVTFDIKVPSADSDMQNSLSNILNTQESIARQVMYLLVLNSFVSDNGTSSSAGMSATASASTGLSLLTNQLSNLLSGDEYKINIRYRPKSETTGLGDEVDLGFSKSLINDRLLVEVEGNYIIDNHGGTGSQQMSNFMGEAYITWLIDRAGTLRLKGFTQTIDRFDENQGLQETGIGVYYKEDFNNFRDLRRRVRERFMGKRRRARIAAADSLKAAEREARLQDSLRSVRHQDSLKANHNAGGRHADAQNAVHQSPDTLAPVRQSGDAAVNMPENEKR